ncbi:MAG: hypothetical protein KatS3mg034_1321 [Vicingaceae bacterium]|nr:MAG: hypothetical protein KatS3mg034_1321 [Vicingaceae bacterium]
MNQKLLFISLLIVLNWSCEDPQNKTIEEEIEIQSAQPSQEELKKRYYQIPSPDEMFAFIKQSGMKYNSNLLIDPFYSEKIVDPVALPVIFGAYTADLAYTAAFEEYQTTIKYFAVVRKLADKIEISSAFDETLVNRIQNNLNSADSLIAITNDSYFQIVDYLEKNQRGNVLGIIAFGGWLESVYIVSEEIKNLNDDQMTNNPIVERFVDQNETLDNIILFLERYSDDPKVAKVLQWTQRIKGKFAQLKDDISGEVKVEKRDGKLVIGSKNNSSKIDPVKIKEAIEIIRQVRSEVFMIQ